MSSTLDTLIIGGGRAGLALGYHLQRTGHRFAVVDAHSRAAVARPCSAGSGKTRKFWPTG
jgi:2-polyprenyl-6-methoxyphenol hydroxylase-like FAD-dependent oxidoreductase